MKLYFWFIKDIFSTRLLSLSIVAVVSTVALVLSGLDWLYLVFVLETFPSQVLYLADSMGFIFPPLAVIVLLILGFITRKRIYRIYAVASLYAILLSITLSTTIKAFTGRTSPPHRHQGGELVLIDNSDAFHFGFLREQVFGGWPSSHATIAFALAMTLILIIPFRTYIKVGLFLVAIFIGIGVTFGFHWLSEFVAGACLGIAIGLSVGQYYRKLISRN